MKHWFSLLLFLASLTSIGQVAESQWQDFGQQVFQLVSDTGALPRLEYIRYRTLENLIEQQDWETNRKAEAKIKANQSYEDAYYSFTQGFSLLVERYRSELELGSSAEFIEFNYSPYEDWEGRYKAQLYFLYAYQGMQSTVVWEFEVFDNGRGLGFIGPPINESY